MTIAALTSNPWALLTLPAGMYLALAVAVARRQSWSGEIKLAVAGTGVVLVAVWLMSFAALMAFFSAAYVDRPLNALGPVAVDGEMAVGTVVWIAVGQAGIRLAELQSWRDAVRWLLSPRPYVALLVALSAGLSSVANAVHPLTSTAGYHLPAPWSYGASAVPGLVMFAVIHQLVILFRMLRQDEAGRAPVIIIDGRNAPNVTDSEPLPGQRTAVLSGPDGRTEALVRAPEVRPGPPASPENRARSVTETEWTAALAELGPDASNDAIAGRLGVHPDSIRRYRRRWPDSGRPRVVTSGS